MAPQAVAAARWVARLAARVARMVHILRAAVLRAGLPPQRGLTASIVHLAAGPEEAAEVETEVTVVTVAPRAREAVVVEAKIPAQVGMARAENVAFGAGES